MKALKLAVGFALVFIAGGVLGGTLKWTGRGDGSKWSDPLNWDATPDWTVANKLDLTALENGATVVNDATKMLDTLTLGENKGTVVIQSSGENVVGTMTLVIPAGTTLDAQFAISAGYTWNAWSLTAQGGGTLWINGSWQAGYASPVITLDNVTTRVKKALGLQSASTFALKSGASLTADVDFSCGNIRSESTVSVFDLNGHNVNFKAASGSFSGELKGAGQITLDGGGDWQLSGCSSQFAGTLIQKTALVSFSGNGQLGSEAKIVSSDTGRLTLANNQTVSSLSGQAARGGVNIPADKTLTVVGVDSGDVGTYGARLAGEGNFTFNAPGKTLFLSGGNALSGKTTVQAGTLVVRNPPQLSGYPAGLVGRYSFDGDIYADDCGMNDLMIMANCKAPTRLATGVGGTGCVHFDGTDMSMPAGLETKAKTFFSGRTPFSVSFWFRETGTTTWANGGTLLRSGLYTTTFEKIVILGSVMSGTTPYLTLQGNWTYHGIWSGKWHQLALVFDGTDLLLYRDGVCAGGNDKKTKNWDIVTEKLGFGYKTNADYDELLVFNRALTAEEVKKLYDDPIPEPTTDDTLRLPAPVAHWTFDDETNPGKDSSENGYDLTVEGGSFAFVSGDKVYGKALKLTKNGAYLRWAGEGLPSKFPQGNASFTVNIRTSGDGGDQGRDIFSMGDVTTAGKNFRMCNQNTYPRAFGYSVNGTAIGGDINYTGWLGSDFYYDYTVVYDAEKGTLTGYRDGVLQLGPTTQAASIDGNGTIYVSYNPAEATHYVGYIDDLQVFDCALDSQQVRRLVQSLETGSLPPALLPHAEVSVASGATLQYTETAELVASISRPAVAGAGTLVLPKKMVVSFADPVEDIYDDETTRYPIVEAAEILGPVDLSAWTFSPLSEKYKVKLIQESGSIYAEIKRKRGIMIMVR